MRRVWAGEQCSAQLHEPKREIASTRMHRSTDLRWRGVQKRARASKEKRQIGRRRTSHLSPRVDTAGHLCCALPSHSQLLERTKIFKPIKQRRMLFLFFMRRKHSPPSGLRVLLRPLRSVFRSARIFTQNRAFQKWQRENPSKNFSDYFAEIVRPGLQRGQAHPTLGRNLSGSAFGEAAGKMLKMLIANGLNKDDVCVDYGCGTLRVGVHVIKYLQRGAYWGLDVDDAVLEEGRKLVGNSLLTDKAPHLHVISPRSIAETAAAKPKII